MDNEKIIVVKPSIVGLDEFVADAERAVGMIGEGIEILNRLRGAVLEVGYELSDDD